MLATLLNTPITIISRAAGAADELGDETLEPTETETVGELQKNEGRGGTEPALAEQLSDTDWTLFLPAGTAIDQNDQVRAEDGRVFEVVGEAWHARNPRTRQESHVEVALRRVAAAGDTA